MRAERFDAAYLEPGNHQSRKVFQTPCSRSRMKEFPEGIAGDGEPVAGRGRELKIGCGGRERASPGCGKRMVQERTAEHVLS
jgi:hypothetical protein